MEIINDRDEFLLSKTKAMAESMMQLEPAQFAQFVEALHDRASRGDIKRFTYRLFVV